MTLSTSRQQFLAYESQAADDIHYGRRGGMFVSSCVCALFVICALTLAILVGVLTYFITYFKVSQTTAVKDFWDETEPYSQNNPSPDLRLPSHVVPSFYRLKLITDLEESTFSGEVYITIRANTPVKEIILHSKNLTISNETQLTEQIYEKVETLHARSKRQVTDNVTLPSEVAQNSAETANSTDVVNSSDIQSAVTNETQTVKPDVNLENTNETQATVTAVDNVLSSNVSVTDNIETTTEQVTQPSIPPLDTQVTHSSVRNIRIVNIQQATGDRLILKLASALTPNIDYTLQVSFSGQISNALTGFYKSTYQNAQNENKKLGVTQFEPTSARAAFPCFDEPAFKAKFEISIAHPENVTVLSNMKVSTEEPIPDKPNWVWTHFDRSVNMSTYLVAYILSDFKSLNTTYLSKDNVTKTIRVWTRPEYIDKARYAATITPKLLRFYEDVFGVPYALDKLDLIAIPDFSSGAMENWGLITFRETTLLFDENAGAPRDKQNVAIDVAHELAHQWFGNLVTMRWWTDLWLNEGFATYIEYLGVDHIEPEWHMFETFARDKMDLLRSDALKNTSPVSRRVVDASEISQKFDEISYSKGANLIRMLNHTISEELFHKGLVIYLNEWKFMNAAENDLWKAMSKATADEPTLKKLSMVEFMNTWTRQAGYPVVKVNRNYEKGVVEIEQKLFTSASNPYQTMIDQLWHIPISYTGMSAPRSQWSTKPKLWLKERFQVVSVPVNSSEALYVNVDAIGYYRVNYDKKNWEMLSTALKAGLVQSPVSVAQLIDDAFNLAKASQLDYSYALGLTTCVVKGEDSKIVWDILLNNMGFLRYNLKNTPGYVYFQEFMRMLLKKQLEKLNYGLDKPKDDNEAFLIENLMMWDCYVESLRCLDWAKSEFNKWMANPEVNEIPTYLRSLVYNIALKYGSRREFDFLWEVFQNSTDPTVKSLVINNLPSTRDGSLIAMLLEKSITEIPKQYAIAAWSVDSPIGTSLAQEFLLDNFDRVYDKFTQMDAFMFPTVLSCAFSFISNNDDLNKLKAFATKYKQKLMPMSQTLQKLIDTATLRISWVNRYAKPINDWFREYVTNSTNVPTTNVPPEAGPSPTMTTSIAASTLLSNASTIYEGPFHLRSPPLGTRVQQLWLLAEILTNNDDEEIFDKSFQISISIDGVLSDHKTINLIPESEATNRTQHLKCKKQLCEEVMVLHLGSLEYTHYVFNIRFYGLREFHKRYYIREIIFYFKTYNPAFTQMETWFRFIFLLTTFTIACWFAHTLRKYSTHDWAIEQKWLSILLPLLLLYNDPIFPLRLVSGSCFAPLMDAIFQTAFIACVMLSWLAQYHGLRQNERGFISFYLFKLIVVALVWLPAMVVTVWQKYYAFYDPTFNYMMNPNYPVVKIMFFSAVTLYFLYLLVLIIKAYSDLRNMPFFDIRLRCLSAGVGTVCALLGALGAGGWGPAALQDHWAAAPRAHHATSAPFMALYGLFNFNIYILAYLFSPAGGSLHETAITKDNPAFSMINDSDEDVIYGSDEESRRPLNSHHRIANEDI